MNATPTPRKGIAKGDTVGQACQDGDFSAQDGRSQENPDEQHARGVHLDAQLGGGRISPWMINSHVKDFGNPPSPIASDYPPSLDMEALSPNGSDQHAGYSGPGEQAIGATSADNSEGSTNPFLEYAIKPCQAADKEAWEESILKLMNEEYAAALEGSSTPAESSSDCNDYTLTPSKNPKQKDSRRAQTSSLSYSSKLFELELSPIFEDAPVLSSSGGLIFPDDSGHSRELVLTNPDPVSDSKDDCGAIYDSSESSYGELMENRTFGSAGCEMHGRVHEYGQVLEQYGTSTEEDDSAELYHEQSYESQLLDPGSFEEESTEPQRQPIIPSLVLIQPTPETTKSSGFFKDHQSAKDSFASDESSMSATAGPRGSVDEYPTRRTQTESDESGRRPSDSTPTWPDTVESSVNTAEAGGHTGVGSGSMIRADEHGTLLPPLSETGPSATGTGGGALQLSEALSRVATRHDTDLDPSTKTKRRWSLVSSNRSKNNTYTKSTTTTDRSRRSSNSVWTRFSSALSSSKKTSVGSLGECGSALGADCDEENLGYPSTINRTSKLLDSRNCEALSSESGATPSSAEERRRSEFGQLLPAVELSTNADAELLSRRGNANNELGLKRVLTSISQASNDRSRDEDGPKLFSLFRSVSSRISGLRGLGRTRNAGRRGEGSKWELGRSVPPKMV